MAATSTTISAMDLKRMEEPRGQLSIPVPSEECPSYARSQQGRSRSKARSKSNRAARNMFRLRSAMLFMIFFGLQLWLLDQDLISTASSFMYVPWCYIAAMLAFLETMLALILQLRMFEAPELVGCVILVKCGLIAVHTFFGAMYEERTEPHPSFAILMFAMWAFADALATVFSVEERDSKNGSLA